MKTTFERLVQRVKALNNGQLPGGIQQKADEAQRTEFWTVDNTEIPTIDSPIGKLIGKNGRKVIEDLLHRTGTDLTERAAYRGFGNKVEHQLMEIVYNIGYRTSAFIDSLIKHKNDLGITEKGPELDLTTSDGYRIQNYYNPTSSWGGPHKEQTLTLPHGTEIFTMPQFDYFVDGPGNDGNLIQILEADECLELDCGDLGFDKSERIGQKKLEWQAQREQITKIAEGMIKRLLTEDMLNEFDCKLD
jgi:hypothetical protein